MLIDLIALGLLAMALFKGFRKGLIVAVFSFVAFVVGLAAALKLSAAAAAYLGAAVSVSQRWLPVLAFTLVFLLVALLVRLGARLLEGAVKMAMLGWLNRLGGIFFYILIYGFIFSILLFYATELHLVRAETAAASVVYPVLQPLAPKIIGWLGVILPFFRDLFGQLLHFFEGAAPSGTTA